MITIQSGKMMIPEEERFVGFAGDNHTNSKQIFLPVPDVYGRTYSLYLRFDDGRVTSADLTAQDADGGVTLTWDIASRHLLKSGIVMAQLKTADSDGTVTHYGADYFIVSESAELADDGSELDVLSRTEFEERMAQAVSDARATAPYIGSDGYWYVYSPRQGEYVRSWSANNITVDSAVSASSANPVENRAVKAYIDAADSLKVDRTQKVAGNTLDHNITPSELYDSLAAQINPRLVEAGATSGYPGQYGRTADGHKPVYCSSLNTWEELAKASDVPAATSDLTNDSGFLTSHQDISGKMNLALIRTGEAEPPGQLFLVREGLSQGDLSLHLKTANDNSKELAWADDIPTATSDLTNDSGFLTSHQDISGKEDKSNKVTSLSSQATDTQYPSAKCVYDKTLRVRRTWLFSDQFENHDTSATVIVGYTLKGIEQYDFAFNTYYNRLYVCVYARDANLSNGRATLVAVDQSISGKENISNKVTSLSASSADYQYPSAKCVYDALAAKADTADVPSKTSDLTNDSGFLTAHQDVTGKMDLVLSAVPANNAGTQPDLSSNEFVQLAIGQAFFCVLQGSQLLYIKTLSGNTAGAYRVTASRTSQLANDSGFLTAHQDVSGKENSSNKVTALSAQSTDTQYPSAKCVFDALASSSGGGASSAILTADCLVEYDYTNDRWVITPPNGLYNTLLSAYTAGKYIQLRLLRRENGAIHCALILALQEVQWDDDDNNRGFFFNGYWREEDIDFYVRVWENEICCGQSDWW